MYEDETTSGSNSCRRRDVLRTVGASAAGIGVLSGTASADASTPSIGLPRQVAPPDPNPSDDFPVPDDFVVTLSGIDARASLFDPANVGTIALPVKDTGDPKGEVGPNDTFWHQGFEKGGKTVPQNTPAFVVGLHSPEVGTGRPDDLTSLIGVRPVVPGEYGALPVPIWAGPPPWQRFLWMQKGLSTTPADFPGPRETVEMTATIWYGPDVFPPIVPRNSPAVVAQTPDDETNGPVSRSGTPITDSAEVTFGCMPRRDAGRSVPTDLVCEGPGEEANRDDGRAPGSGAGNDSDPRGQSRGEDDDGGARSIGRG